MQTSLEEANKTNKINDYTNISKSYSEILNEGIELWWKNLTKDTPEELDPCDYFNDEMEMLQLLKYRLNLLLICCLSEVFEQDLYTFIKGQDSNYNCDTYNQMKKYIENKYNFKIDTLFPLINQMRDLTNSIKHGEGPSFRKLRKFLGDNILKDSNWGRLLSDGTEVMEKEYKFFKNTLINETLDVENKNEAYGNEVIKFWKHIWSLEKNINS